MNWPAMLRTISLLAIFALSMRWLRSCTKNGEIVVLTVHGVPDYAHPHVTTPPDLFEAYLEYLRDNRYTVIAMRDLAKFIDSGKARQVPTGATHSSKQ